MTGITRAAAGAGSFVDFETLEDENHKLKLALNRVIEENKHYRVNRVRLEGELLRSDGRVEMLLDKLDQAPSKRWENGHRWMVG